MRLGPSRTRRTHETYFKGMPHIEGVLSAGGNGLEGGGGKYCIGGVGGGVWAGVIRGLPHTGGGDS